MRFHIQPSEPNICKCGNTIAPEAWICGECVDQACSASTEDLKEAAREYAQREASYSEQAEEAQEMAYAEQYAAYYDGEGW